MILEKVKETIKRYRLIGKGDKVLIGVSGGPDSTALTLLLDALKKELKLNLHIAHLDHMLRKDSGKDREFVEGLARQLKIPVTAAEINVKELKKWGSLEEIARNARLGFLFKTAREVRADKIALGHNLDDQAETVLMRVIRGTGLYGLAGILPKRDICGYQVIRPLIEIKRAEIEKFLRTKKAKPRRDTSNLEEIFFRNKVRNKLLPLLEKDYNKNIKEILSNMAQSSGMDYDYLARASARAFKAPAKRLDLAKLERAHPAIRRLALRMGILGIAGDTRRITFTHMKELEDLVLNRPVNSIVDLPKGVSAVKRKNHLSFYSRK
ncbi:MAG: tRNA lysidine(34) synthetase TilS [Candidatus Omnitrophica bacterium]|nr:tRNA lysidine(34) synthetase TilS [Candidatus Omnitrophota bacterium]MDD5553963.1 tRNA lysidine(34) synthetase TilS [Candidatus Omnitrophota bacterium]